MNNNSGHVLIIDDNEDLLVMLETMLTLKNYKVSVRKNVDDDLTSFVQRLSPDLIVMDMLLSGGDGREVCKLFKSNEELRDIPVLMISAYPKAQSKCLEAGADYFLSKPFEMTEMLDSVANLLDKNANKPSSNLI